MDIAGAKALKERLGSKRTEEAPSAPADVPADAPPVFRWLGVARPAPESSPRSPDDVAGESASLFRRLGLSFR